mmetsp:Transcript_13701/g.20515  ORF Transcript_13701/g.20515 Transcript_13701/m.20515 type:complete len:691 (+) Transcript_13701:88-2160(+)|eukprot:CAMPEP_0185019060 /NCGR_PEP_ID=MMETSP1103-20130426/1673_1 /TAXON_ID=36769 /ORGANISM="Paraphysomonas bandaiensis, Strain Caron Lab Isolate" /LENGTH=690 /DNA_ID=CAMNT_0027549139 /DNA_START=88 /DNA_END=2163 /DNA_ORIENTATION=-
METDSSNKVLRESLAYLIGYFVSTVSHDTDEWIAWGVPYIRLCVESLDLDSDLTDKIRSTFMGSIGHIGSSIGSVGSRMSLYVYADEDNEWTHIRPLHTYLEEISLKLDQWDEKLILSFFLQAMSRMSANGYDARFRVLLAHRICHMFQLPVDAVKRIETTAVTTAGGVPAFKTAPETKIGESVGTFRAWKVGFAAASGGALMFCAGGMSAPAIVSSILTLMGTSGTTSTLVINMTSLLTHYGIRALTSAMTTMGAGVASWKMFRRTDALREFLLEPLQPPRVTHMSESTLMIGDSGSSVPDISANDGVGVYILVPGHCSEKADLQELWGCDMYLEKALEDDVKVGVKVEVQNEGNIEVKAAVAVESCDVSDSDDTNNENTGSIPTEDSSSSGEQTLENSWASLSQDICGRQIGWWRSVMSESLSGDPYVLHWDMAAMHRLYHAQRDFLLDKSVHLAAEELLKLASPVFCAAALPLAVLERASEIDCPWLVAMDRAEQAGKLLASVLLNNKEKADLSSSSNDISPTSNRPVTLIGYGMGARVIFHCLNSLAAEGDRGRGIVESAVLIGTPVGTHRSEWAAARRVVAGRLVNCYSTHDWFLALMYRCRSWDVGVAGIQPVYCDASHSVALQPLSETSGALSTTSSGPRMHIPSPDEMPPVGDIENIDITHMVRSHVDYADSLVTILGRVFS